MANGQCSSGADTAKIFAKFGHGETGCSAMRDIHRVYNYDYGSIDGMTDGCGWMILNNYLNVLIKSGEKIFYRIKI